MAFRFTADQRRALLACGSRWWWWRRAPAYLDAIEPRVGAWLELHAEPTPTHADIRDDALKLAAKLAAVRRALDSPRLDAALLHGHDVASEADIRQAVADLRAAGDLIERAAEAVAASIPVDTGPDTGPERLLVAWLAVLYRRAFGRKPSRSKNAPFRQMLAELGPILGRHFGPATITAGIDDASRGCFVPPATGWHIGRDKIT